MTLVNSSSEDQYAFIHPAKIIHPRGVYVDHSGKPYFRVKVIEKTLKYF